jgi:hypothetical protein
VVEHKAVSKLILVDALSRHVGAAIHGSLLEKENVLREQAKDAFCVSLQEPTVAENNFF